MQTQKILLPDKEATIALGRKIATKLKPRIILDLQGDLGSGKTTLTQGIISSFAIDIAGITSPTFSLVHEFHTQNFKIYHCDFYRLTNGSTLEELGGVEFFYENAIYIIEWCHKLCFYNKLIKNQSVKIEMQFSNQARICSIPTMWQ